MKRFFSFLFLVAIAVSAAAQTNTPTDTPTVTPTRTPTSTPTSTLTPTPTYIHETINAKFLGWVGGQFSVTVGPVLASAATIYPLKGIHHVSGTTQITRIQPPWAGFTGCIRLIPDAAFTTATGGNIALGSTAVANKVLIMCYDGSTWTPSY